MVGYENGGATGILDIGTMVMTPSVVDALDVMEERGPRRGLVKRRGLLLAGGDCIGIDTVISNFMGKHVSEIPVLRVAKKYKCGETDVKGVEVVGDIEVSMKDFKFSQVITPISFSYKGMVKSILWHLWILFKERNNRYKL